MVNDPKDAKGGAKAGALKNAGAKAGAGGAKAGGAVAECKWELFVKVHSQERFWPKDSFKVNLHKLSAKKDLAAVEQTGAVKMIATDSPDVHFKGAGKKDYGVTATVKDLKKEADWKLVNGAASKDPLPKGYEPVSLQNGCMGAAAKKVDLYIRHPLTVHLQLKFKDPEKKVLLFPKNFPVQVYNDVNKVVEVKTDDKGQIHFEMDRKYDWFTLKFGGSKVLISNGDGKKETTELKDFKFKTDLIKKAAKFFSPPTEWGLVESIWKFSEEPKYIDGTVSYKDAEGKIYIFDPPKKNWVRRIGEEKAPLVLTLDPHWQFVRFEYFDRYYGHSDHAHERVNSPTLFVEGYWGPPGKKEREGGGYWTLNAEKVKESVHCLPWVRQKDDKGVKKERPSKDALIMFQTDKGTFVDSKDAKKRVLEILDPVKDAKRLKASADRLKLYDLPEVWKSTNYFARYKDGAGKHPGKFFEDWDDAGYAKSRDPKTPMVFSLDDVVLTNAALNTLKFAATDRFAVFYHRFKPDYNEKANVSNEGVYKPDTANQNSFYSDLKFVGKDFNYLTEYPNWVRLIAGVASLFDTFSERTTGAVIGARAGVRWYDAVASGAPAGGPPPAPPAIAKPYFVVQPYYFQENAAHWLKFVPPPATPLAHLGRFDQSVLRCCDHLGAKELFLNLNYFRFNYNFLATSTLAGKVNAAKQTTYIDSSAKNLINRWNGNDVASKNRTQFLPQDGKTNVQGESVFFIQPAATTATAHFRLDVDNLGAGRAWMNGADGTGSIDDNDSKVNGAFGDPNGYVFAHEFGHGASLPDEYGEWWNNCSDWGPGILNNTPGDPFVDEGRDFDLPKVLAVNRYPLMTMAVEQRNRYFWHNAEFARKYLGVPFYVKQGTYEKYKVPGHPNFPVRSYTYWPVQTALDATRGANGKFDVYLHTAGEERFTKDLLTAQFKTKGVFDGFLSVLLKIRILFPGGVGAPAQLRDIIRNAMLALNGQFYAKGVPNVPTDAGNKDVTLNKVVFRVSPRFLIDPANYNPRSAADTLIKYTKDFNSLAANVGTHFNTKVIKFVAPPKGVLPPVSGFKAPYNLDLVVDFAKPTAKADLSAQAKQFFNEMLGVKFDPKHPNLKNTDLKAIAGLVIKKNADVGKLP